MAVRSFHPPCLWRRRLAALAFLVLGLCGHAFVCAAAQVPAASEKDQQARVAALIEQLGDENYHRRNDAKWELERIGLTAFEKLRQAAQTHPDAQVARAARYLIDSQDVVWWLESDGLEVRELLKKYNESKSDQRDATLQSLSDIGSPDAILALCRLARFESSELRSKSAALFLMQAISLRLKSLQTQPGSAEAAQLSGSIALTLGDSQRTAATWLRALMAELDADAAAIRTGESTTGESTTGENAQASDRDGQPTQVDRAGVARWKQIVEQELALAEQSVKPSAAGTLTQAAESPAELLITLRLYRWIGTWVTERYGRAPALELVRTSLSLVGQDPQALVASAAWAIEAELPELVSELAERYPDQFSQEPQLGYYMAEAHLRLGDEAAAQRAAETAGQAVVKQLDQLKNLPNLNLEDIQANRHYQYARLLAQRGLFAWSEQQYLKAVELDSRIEAGIRADLAQFYWFGGEYDKAARTLQPLAEEAMANRQTEFPVQADIYSNPAGILASYHFYSGLAALDRGEKLEASTQLRRAIEVDGASPNPDVVIALQRLGSEEPFGDYFQQAFERMSNSLRVRVLEAEEQLARSNDRVSRSVTAPRLAQECNQLAWLLSKCEISTAEALSLSLRSLELMPEESVYLDTLARCYFATGQLEDAIRTQKQAIRSSPHERQMLGQLAEFEAALAARGE